MEEVDSGKLAGKDASQDHVAPAIPTDVRARSSVGNRQALERYVAVECSSQR